MKKGQPLIVREFLKGSTLKEWQSHQHQKSFLSYQHHNLLLSFAQQILFVPLRPTQFSCHLFRETEGGEDLHYDLTSRTFAFEICLRQSGNWPFFINSCLEYQNSSPIQSKLELTNGEIEEIKLTSTPYLLNPGDLIFYSGVTSPHWRNSMPAGNFSERAFFYFESR